MKEPMNPVVFQDVFFDWNCKKMQKKLTQKGKPGDQDRDFSNSAIWGVGGSSDNVSWK